MRATSINPAQRQLVEFTFKMAFFDTLVENDNRAFQINDAQEAKLEKIMIAKSKEDVAKYQDEDLAAIYDAITSGSELVYIAENDSYAVKEVEQFAYSSGSYDYEGMVW